MTVGQACGSLVQAYIDKEKLTATARREILRMIPPDCRFVNPKTHQIDVQETVGAVLAFLASAQGRTI